MPELRTKSYEELLTDLIILVRASTDKITDFNEGSVTKAYLESIAYLSTYLGSLIEQLEDKFYYSLSQGDDLDKRAADFDILRNEGTYSTGYLGFYAYTAPSADIEIPIGTIVKTAKDEQGFYLEFETTQEIILNSSNTYTSEFPYLNSGTARSLQAGLSSNVSARKIVELSEDVAGIVGVINIAPFTGGTESESDLDFRTRIRLYMQSLAKGTRNALKAAILNVDGVNNVEILDWNDDSSIDPGYMKIILDSDNNNTVDPADEILLGTEIINKEIQIAVWDAIKDDVKACGAGVLFSQTSLIPIDIKIIVKLTPESELTLSQTLSMETFKYLFKARIEDYFNNLKVNENILWSKILQIAMNISGVVGVSSITLDDTTILPNIDGSPAFTDIILTDNQKGILNILYVNGDVI